MKYSLPLIIVILTVVGCKPTVPSTYIQPDELEDILYDYHVAQAMARSQYSETDMQSHVMFQSVLRKHHVSEADFDSSLVYYYSHVDRLSTIYEHVNGRLADEAARLGTAVGDISHYSQYSATGDTANIWTGRTAAVLIPRPTMSRFDFRVKADTTFRKGDSFMFQFSPEYIWQGGEKDAVVCISATYEGDSIVQVVNHATGQNTVQLMVPSNKSAMLKELRGFIYLTEGSERAPLRKMMFVSQIQLIRFHHSEKPTPHETETADSVRPANSMQRSEESRGIPVPATGSRVIGRSGHGDTSPEN